MNISIDYIGCYTEHKEFFDAFAAAMQKDGHRVGIITGERESKRGEYERNLGFKPDFMHLWANEEFIVNGSQWKVDKMNAEQVQLHFDDDATHMKLWTNLWVVKTLNPADPKKF